MADDHRFVFPTPEERGRAKSSVPEAGEGAAWGSLR
jgi:hypothetical protein